MPKVQLPHATNARVGGARPGRTGTRTRDRQVLIRFTEEEFAAIQAAAHQRQSPPQSPPSIVGRVEVHRSHRSGSAVGEDKTAE